MRTPAIGIVLSGLLIGVFALAKAEARQSGASATEKKTGTETVYSEIGQAPEKARAKRNPLENDSDAVAAGRVLFEQRCAECHGAHGEGSKKGPSLRAAEIQNAEPGAIFWILTNGVVRKGMPVWSKLPEPQRWQLVRYIKSLGAAPAKTETSSPRAKARPVRDDMPRKRWNV